ncbi:MAG: ester cyclase [Cytophaga sp.]|uniref:ester cyclase n=1 Tax=Cytophaga sp. TaxID=29535 RepID=UPI003F7DEFBF
MENSKIVSGFIEQIWNKRNFEKSAEYIHPDFKDHSLPTSLAPNVEGMKQWILNTGTSFEHQTIIEDQITEGDKSVVKIKMVMKHIGRWRGLEPTGIELTTVGYRYYKLQAGKIIEHWALIDGQALENQIMNASKGCKIAE